MPPLCPVAKGKRVMFVFLLEILTGKEGAGLSRPGPVVAHYADKYFGSVSEAERGKNYREPSGCPF